MATTTTNPLPTGQAADRTLMKVGGAMAVLGTGLALAGNVLHPQSTGYYDDPVAWLDHNTESSVWFASHMLILVGTIVLVGAFVALARSLAGTRGHGLRVLGLANALIGAIVMLVLLVIDGLVVPELSDVWVAHGAHSDDAVLSGTILYYTIFNLLYVSMMTLFGLAPIFYGVAMLLGRTFARWFGWAGVVLGSSVVGSALLSMLDVNREVLDAKVWPVTSSLVVFWFLGAGLVLWRRAANPSGLAASAGGDQGSASERSLDIEGALV